MVTLVGALYVIIPALCLVSCWLYSWLCPVTIQEPEQPTFAETMSRICLAQALTCLMHGLRHPVAEQRMRYTQQAQRWARKAEVYYAATVSSSSVVV